MRKNLLIKKNEVTKIVGLSFLYSRKQKKAALETRLISWDVHNSIIENRYILLWVCIHFAELSLRTEI